MTTFDTLLVLEDGRHFRGQGAGAPGESCGELVFNTSMTGYQEIATDPSYAGQIVTLTGVMVGTYGVRVGDSQTPGRDHAQLAGLVVRELSRGYSNQRAEGDLDGWLRAQGVVAISEVDTRALTRHLRDKGAMRGGIFRGRSVAELPALLERVRQSPKMEGLDLASRVSTREAYRQAPAEAPPSDRAYHLAVVDLGVKQGILDGLTSRGCSVEVLPHDVALSRLLEAQYDGVVLSNGPGDPAAVEATIATARGLIGTKPVLGICLGYQILALALGARTYKLPFGHHGGNHPVSDLASGAVWITAQNHGFAVDPQTLPASAQPTHFSLYDKTLEGFTIDERSLIAVQFHPEAGPGPSDAQVVFDRFVQLLSSPVGPAARVG